MHDALTPHQHDLIARGLAYEWNGRLIPIIQGAEDDEHLFSPIPDDLSALDADELAALEESLATQLSEVAGDSSRYVTADFTAEMLLEDARTARAGLDAVRAAIAELNAEDPPDDADPDPDADAPADEAALEAIADELADLAADPVDPPAAEIDPLADDPAVIVAAPAPPAVMPPRPARSVAARPVPTSIPRIALTAASSSYAGVELGQDVSDPEIIGRMVLAMHRRLGAPTGERHPILKADWTHTYPEARQLTTDVGRNLALVAAATDQAIIRAEMARRKAAKPGSSLTAAGGWCAPVTPYYDLQTFGSTDRPVRNALPGFDASRGGIRAARPASLGSINDAVGIVTAAEDAEGGTFAAKSCQTPECPDFVDVQANAVYHCLQFGNMVARAFPELVAQWTDLTMTAEARLAESHLLTRIDSLSTQVTADGVTLGATSTLLPQIITAGVAMRNRHRMDADMVLRVLLPEWVVPLLITDVIKSQFDRFTTDEAKITAVLRRANIEPTYYKDGAAGRGQVFGPQNDGVLLTFPDHVTWYLYPEGSFLYLDGGTLEIGIVRDSVLNLQNDFQLFGELFEEVAFVGVEALAVDSEVCASGVVAAPDDSACPVSYA